MLADDFIYRTHFGAEADKAGFLESIASFPVKIISIRRNSYGRARFAIRTSGMAKLRPTDRRQDA
jgi:hypothetical protein